MKFNETIETLKEGKIITLDNKDCFEPRYYRFKNESVQYSDDLKKWKKSSMELVDFQEDYKIVE